MTHDGKEPRNDTHGAAHGEAQTALYALLAGAEGCGPAARSARLAQDDELADFLLRVQGEVVEEAGRLLAERASGAFQDVRTTPQGRPLGVDGHD
jgi:hypothetical protein